MGMSERGSVPHHKRERTENRIKGLKILKSVMILYILPGLFLCPWLLGIQDYSLDEALKVKKLLNQIQSKQNQKEKGEWQEAVISESELNSYVAYRIERAQEEILRELQFKLFDHNRVEGKMNLDIRTLELSNLFKPQIDLYFRAKLLVEKGKGKLRIKKLFLHQKPIQPTVLNMIISSVSQKEDTEYKSIGDWYELPQGIENIKTKKGRLVVVY